MEAVSTSALDSSDSQRVNDMMDKYTDISFGQVKNGAEGARSFDNLDTLAILSATNLDSEFEVFEKAFGPNHDGSEELLKLEPGPWVEIPVSSLPLKNEREPPLISAQTRSEFHLAPNVNTLDVCTSSVSPCHSPMMDSNSGLMVDLNQTSATGPMTQLAFEPSTTPPLVCKSELGSWDSHLWFERPGQVGFASQEIVGSSGFIQRSPTFYSAIPGVHSQRVCVICGDEASGCHYGVLTCGSCKVFFKRAVEGHHNYLCAGRNDCIVDKIRRKNCPACRLRKCYQAGMMLGGRKLKRFGVLKSMGLCQPLMFQGHTLTSMPCMPGFQELQLSPQFINILESIEPETVYSGYDNSQPEQPHLLLNSLNRLCERQLLWIVKWSKSLPGFRNLHINDQMTLIQYSWMNLMVFSLGWRSFQNVSPEYLYFAPDLVLSQDRMRRSPIYDLCMAMQLIPQEFAKLQVTKEEFLCMKALMLLNTVPLEGLKSQGQFDDMRQNYIRELTKAIQMKEKGVVGSSQRFYHLTKLMDSMHEIVKKVNLYCLSTFIQADAMRVEFPEMMTEVIASQLPKVLAGMVRPLLFHGK
ncbi:progesterone receptor [Trichomycterus rosablanca]|uniref:progesterone receptor n=1 Tax=Trichomycterus rosablanca TaxID=2290929 RepID=UPI002F3515B8